MNIIQLQAFCEVIRTGSVSEAARNLFRTQPAISASISSLEKNLGHQLFSRIGGRLQPVPEALYLYEEAKEILNRLNQVEQTLKSVRNLESGTIRIVAMPGPSTFLLPDYIGQFVENRDKVKVTLITRNSLQVQQLVSVQQYDVGLADLGVIGSFQSPLIQYHTIRLECVCAIAANDPLAQKKKITARDLAGKPLATLFSDHPSYIQTKAGFDKLQVPFTPRFETQYFIPLLTFVERGLAYSIVDPWSAESYKKYSPNRSAVVFKPYRPAVVFEAAIMTPIHKPLSLITEAFVKHLQEQFDGICSV